jgi:hypothetical protein
MASKEDEQAGGTDMTTRGVSQHHRITPPGCRKCDEAGLLAHDWAGI